MNPVIPSWDELFMRHVYLIASKSKDTRTKVGAILVKDKRVIAEGYNGICQSVNDSILERYERPEKYFWFEHAERNSVYDCARRGISSLGAISYTNGIPCVDCARGIIQAGITEVVVHKQWQEFEQIIHREKWQGHNERSIAMFTEAGIKIRVYDKLLGIQGFLDGRIIPV
jgi:dCMP deaminase